MDHVLVNPTVDGGVEAFRGVLLHIGDRLLGVPLIRINAQWEVVSAELCSDDGRMVLSGDTNGAMSTCTSPRTHHTSKTQKYF